MILTSAWRALGRGAITTYILSLTQPALAGLEFTTIQMLSESTTTRLPQLVTFPFRHTNIPLPTVYGAYTCISIDRLFIITSRSRVFHLYGDVTINGEGLPILGLCSGPLSKEGSLSCHTCCDRRPRFIRSHPKDQPIQSPLTTHEEMWRIYSNPDHHGYNMYLEVDSICTCIRACYVYFICLFKTTWAFFQLFSCCLHYRLQGCKVRRMLCYLL
jgi:hypothetical protein